MKVEIIEGKTTEGPGRTGARAWQILLPDATIHVRSNGSFIINEDTIGSFSPSEPVEACDQPVKDICTIVTACYSRGMPPLPLSPTKKETNDLIIAFIDSLKSDIVELEKNFDVVQRLHNQATITIIELEKHEVRDNENIQNLRLQNNCLSAKNEILEQKVIDQIYEDAGLDD